MIFVKIPGMGDRNVTLEGYHDGTWFVADSFTFGVERELKESGSKGGTADINIGVGELQECTISKSLDMASASLAQFAINGNSPGQAQIDFVEVAGGDSGRPQVYLRYKLDRCFVKSWSTSGAVDGRPIEEFALYFNKIAFRESESGAVMSWDTIRQAVWPDHGL